MNINRILIGNVIAFLAIVICEWLWFGPVIGHIGFYLDDWQAYSDLFFSKQDLPSLIQTSLNDGRIVTRPIEAIVFASSWFLFHDHVFFHHLLTCTFEVAAAWFLYLSMSRLSACRSLSLLAAILFLVYPNHDATHYWVTANPIPLSLAFCLASLWLAIKSAQENSNLCQALSVITMALSLFTYEAFLPFVAVIAACYFYLNKKNNNWNNALAKSSIFLFALALVCLSTYAYQRLLLPSIGHGYHHAINISLEHALTVIQAGCAQTIFPEAFFVFANRAQESLSIFNFQRLLSLIALIATCEIAIIFVSNKDEKLFHPFSFIGLGIAIIVLSFAIYAFAPEYEPCLTSILSRVNMGGSVGACLLLTGLIGASINTLADKNNKLVKVSAISALSAPLIIFFILANWGWSLPWIASWEFQKDVVNKIRTNASKFHSGDSIILANAARYDMWSPVFDGVWDFQAMLRMQLKNKNIKGGIVSERMVLSKNTISDISQGYLCAIYPFDHLWVFIQTPEQWIQIKSAEQFIDLIENKGMTFGLDKAAISRWRKEIQE